jgi:sulfoxide reductase catalytic subunit YedY
MLIRMPADIPSYEITPERHFFARRSMVKALGLGTALAALPGAPGPARANDTPFEVPPVDEVLTPEAIVTSFNNFYEFGTDKADPARYAHRLTTRPWQVKVSGEAEVTGEFDYEDMIKGFVPEERIYRFRCVDLESKIRGVHDAVPPVRDAGPEGGLFQHRLALCGGLEDR